VIPERAAALFWVRALEDDVLENAYARVVQCADAAAAAAGARLELVAVTGESPPMQPNLPLAELYRGQLDLLGLPESHHAPDASIGSSDITHVSRVVPTIHPNFPIGENLQLHTRAFAAATTSARGEQGLLEGARALALTVLALARSADARAGVAAAHPLRKSA